MLAAVEMFAVNQSQSRKIPPPEKKAKKFAFPGDSYCGVHYFATKNPSHET